MDSLRTRRPSDATRRPARSPSKIHARVPRVDDKLRKRMSMRYADIPPDDKMLFSAEDFDPDACRFSVDTVTHLLNTPQSSSSSSQTPLRQSLSRFSRLFVRLRTTLHPISSAPSSRSMPRLFFSCGPLSDACLSYAEFVLISKEISAFENEMLELKDLLSDYKSMPSILHIPDPTASGTAALSTYKRSSVADLRVLYLSQMQSLHASIEGAAKLVPTTPGRHVIGEVDGFYALNAATYKIVGKVKFVILDDAVLVARRRRRNAGGPGDRSNQGKLVAENCWAPNDILVLDIKDTSSACIHRPNINSNLHQT